MNDLSKFSNYSSNISSIYNSDENVLEKEFRNGQVQEKSFAFRLISQMRSLFWKTVDRVAHTSFLHQMQDTQRNRLVEQNWNYHQNPDAAVPRVYRHISKRDMPLINKVSAQFAQKMGNDAPLAFLKNGIHNWVLQSNEFTNLTPPAKEALAAIYGSGLIPSALAEFAGKEPLLCETPDDLATVAQVLNIYEKVKAYKDAAFPDYWREFLIQGEEGKWRLNEEAMAGVPFKAEDLQKLELFVATQNLMPHNTIDQILKIGHAIQQTELMQDDVLNGSPIRSNYLADLKRANLPIDVPIDDKTRTPLPTQKQLEAAVKEAYRLFGDVTAFENDSSRAFFARTIQYLLVGEQLPLVNYPEDDCCFTYQEIRPKPQTIGHFDAPNYTLRSLDKEGSVIKALRQVMQDFARGIPTTTVLFKNERYAYPSHDIARWRNLLAAVRQDFVAQALQNPHFLKSYEGMRNQLPVQDKLFYPLIRTDLKKLAGVPENIKEQFSHLLTEFADVSSESAVNEAWRVELLQFLIHMHQGLPAELIVPTQLALSPDVDGFSKVVPRHDVIVVDHNNLSIQGEVEFKVQANLVGEQLRPNFVQTLDEGSADTYFTTAARIYNRFEAPLHRIGEGARSETQLWEDVFIPPHMVFHPELLKGLSQRSAPLIQTTGALADELEADLDKIPLDNLKHLLVSGKPNSWDELKTLMLCFRAREKALPLFEKVEKGLGKFGDYITRDPDGAYRIKATYLPGVGSDWGRKPLSPSEYALVKETVALLNRLNIEKNQEVRILLEKSKGKDFFKDLEWLHQQFQGECNRVGVSPVVAVDVNSISPTAAQLKIAQELLQQQMRGFPEVNSKPSKAFLGRLLQLILVGPVPLDKIPYPVNDLATTERLEDVSKNKRVPSVGAYLETMTPKIIPDKIRAFINQKSYVVVNDSRYPLNAEFLGALLPKMRGDFNQWLSEPGQLPLAMKQLERVRAKWGLSQDNDEAYRTIQEWFLNADLGEWGRPFKEVLKDRGTPGNLLWAVHLLEFVLLSQPAFAAEYLQNDVSQLLNTENTFDKTFLNQTQAIYEIEGTAWIGRFAMAMGTSRGINQPQAQVLVEAVQNNLYQRDAHVNLTVNRVEFTPYFKGDVAKVERALNTADPAAGVFP